MNKLTRLSLGAIRFYQRFLSFDHGYSSGSGHDIEGTEQKVKRSEAPRVAVGAKNMMVDYLVHSEKKHAESDNLEKIVQMQMFLNIDG